jgi:uncharacterized protein (TIGR00369 family)
MVSKRFCSAARNQGTVMIPALKPTNPAYETVVRESFARVGLMGTLGAWLVEIKPGLVTIEVTHNKRLSQQQGFFHGGVIGAIADSAGGYAALSLMPEKSDVVTVEYKINFMRPALGPLLRATGTVIRAGRSITVARVDCVCGPPDAPEACAVLQATFMRVERA